MLRDLHLVCFHMLRNFRCDFSPPDYLRYCLRYTKEKRYYREWHLKFLVIWYVIRMHSYVTSIYMHVICMSQLGHSYVLTCYSHNINMSLACHLYVFLYHLYVINMLLECHSFVHVHYPHTIHISLLYQSYIIYMPLLCNHMSLACVFIMDPSKQIKWYIHLKGCNTILWRLLAVHPIFSKLFRLVVLSCII